MVSHHCLIVRSRPTRVVRRCDLVAAKLPTSAAQRHREGGAAARRNTDMQTSLKCGPGELNFIAAILEQPVIQNILTHLGLEARVPPRAPARGSQLQEA